MEENQFLRDQYATIRREIEGIQSRLFWTVIIGILGVPTINYLTWDTDVMIWLVQPFFMLVLIVLFLAEHHQMMRAGRFMREEIEPRLRETPSWESWLESKPEFRLLDRHFFGCFTLIFFLYYAISMGTAIERLWIKATSDESGLFWSFFYAGLVAYFIATVWVIVTLIQHWRSSVGTSEASKSSGQT